MVRSSSANQISTARIRYVNSILENGQSRGRRSPVDPNATTVGQSSGSGRDTLGHEASGVSAHRVPRGWLEIHPGQLKVAPHPECCSKEKTTDESPVRTH